MAVKSTIFLLRDTEDFEISEVRSLQKFKVRILSMFVRDHEGYQTLHS